MRRASKVWIKIVLAWIPVSAAMAAEAGPYRQGSGRYGKAPAPVSQGPQEAPAAAEAATPAAPAPAPRRTLVDISNPTIRAPRSPTPVAQPHQHPWQKRSLTRRSS